jgi:hypothetical protein
MDRRKVIETLFENLRDKSKVKTSHSAVKIFCHSEGVEVETADGSLFHGDLVVGADGVHSRVRREMQRIAAEHSPGLDLFPEAHGELFCLTSLIQNSYFEQHLLVIMAACLVYQRHQRVFSLTKHSSVSERATIISAQLDPTELCIGSCHSKISKRRKGKRFLAIRKMT